MKTDILTEHRSLGAADPHDRSLRPGEFATLCVLAEGRGLLTLDKRFVRALTGEIVALRARLTARERGEPEEGESEEGESEEGESEDTDAEDLL